MKKACLGLVVVVFFSLTAIAQTTIPFGNNPAVGKYATVNGIQLYYEIYGEGQPLLLLHGNGGSIHGRANEIPIFSKKYKVIAVDSRCHGKSGCNVADLNYEMMAADINDLLDHLKIDSCLIWGQSDGGILGLIMAFQYPDKVKKLITTGANIQADTTAIFPQLVSLINMYPMIKDTMQQKQFRLMAFHPNISFEKLKAIKAPVLIMGGDRDAVKTEHTVKIYQAIPNAQLCIVPGSTHFFAIEKPGLFMEIVADFFERPFEMPSTIKISQQWAEQIRKQVNNK